MITDHSAQRSSIAFGTDFQREPYVAVGKDCERYGDDYKIGELGIAGEVMLFERAKIFSWKQCARQMLSLFEEVAGRGQKAGEATVAARAQHA